MKQEATAPPGRVPAGVVEVSSLDPSHPAPASVLPGIDGSRWRSEAGFLRKLLWVSLAGPLLLVISAGVAAGLDPGYSDRDPVSLLAAEGAPTAPIVTFGFLASGLALMVMMAVVWRLGTPLGRVVPLVGFGSGALITAASFFPCSPGCPAPWGGEAAPQDVVHFGLVVTSVAGFAAAPVLTWGRLWHRRVWVSYRRATGFLAVLVVAGGFLTFTSEALPVAALAGTVGIWQRISMAGSLAWFSLTAAVVLVGSESLRSGDSPVDDEARSVTAR
jgi:hypothetical protein